MILLFVFIFTVVPVLELYLLLQVGQWIGAWDTVGIVLLTGILGAWIARSQGRVILRSTQERLQRGEIPADSLLHGILVFFGGLLLISPGFITDVVGLILIFPWTRRFFLKMLREYFMAKLRSGRLRVQFGRMDQSGVQWQDMAHPHDWRDVTATQQDPPALADVIDLESARRERPVPPQE